jgi:hypothetical protein
MSPAEQLIERIETAGGVLTVNGDQIRYQLPEDAVHLLNDLRAYKAEILALLSQRVAVPPMPAGVRLVRWDPKPAPVALTRVGVVIDVPKFVAATLLELRAALAGKPCLSGHHSVRELTERLEQCGLAVEVEGE